MVMPGAQKKQKTIFDLIDKGTAQDFADYIAEHPESIEAFGTQYKCTPLIWAAYTGKAECLKLLIKAGANLDSQDKDLDTALSSASKMGHGECVNLLLEAGADTTIITAGGKTAEEHAESQHIRNIFIKAFCGRFIKESNTIVFINELVESCDLTIKTIYNFKAATITTQGKDNDGQSLFVQEFNALLPQKQLTQAAKFLKQQENGDLCGFKLPVIQ